MVSVVVATKDRAQLLDQTLRSIAEQTAPATEVIVADDGSTDATAEVVSRHGATLVRNAAGGWGAAGARNAGLAKVSTEYVAFVDSDDLLLPDALATLVPALEARADAPFAFGQGLAAARTGAGWSQQGLIRAENASDGALLGALYVRNSVPSSGALVRVAEARSIGGYDATLDFVEDHDFWVRLARLGEPVPVAELVCVYRIHPQNRHAPAGAAADVERVTALADGDARLLPRLPDRLGVELCEAALAGIKAHRPAEVLRAARVLLLRRPGKVGILRGVARHIRERRARFSEGAELWGSRQDLREWLGSY
jgi:glycosyltransferase involved in cell wall biosynthesis